MRVHDAVIVHHGHHEPAGERVPIGVEFGEAGGGDYDAGGEFGLEDVEGKVEGFDECLRMVRYILRVDIIGNTDGRKTVVWCTREGDQVDLWGWLGHGDFAGVADGDIE